MSSVPEFGFNLQSTDGMARRGQLTTAWGVVERRYLCRSAPLPRSKV